MFEKNDIIYRIVTNNDNDKINTYNTSTIVAVISIMSNITNINCHRNNKYYNNASLGYIYF